MMEGDYRKKSVKARDETSAEYERFSAPGD